MKFLWCSSASISKLNGLTKLLIVTFLFFNTISVALNVDSPGVDNMMNVFVAGKNEVSNHISVEYNIVKFERSDDLPSLLEKYSNTDTILINSNNKIAYSDITNVDITEKMGQTKRFWKSNLDTVKYSWRQWKLKNHGYWWSTWYLLTNCTDKSDVSTHEKQVSIAWNYTYTGTCNQDISVNWGAIKALFPSSVSHTISRNGLYTCKIPPGGRGQIWYQQHIGWADYQVQDCTSDKSGTSCDQFGPYIRIDIPTIGNKDYRIGCTIITDDSHC
ncbi:similar to Saccharomyces cerevisiae YCL049C Protein of unknown function [Maudiozyma saulgeensis]|uniref:Uncharacterized protein n=1 Tax=Maudiozyma saulgeensis TaxID=1789683 RepID=A0A1X7R6Y0_9SACH|nr:similar to Saccharomyces cerevisiae YCL049C Protein of unknown function [Kazachstania saulgeensis]